MQVPDSVNGPGSPGSVRVGVVGARAYRVVSGGLKEDGYLSWAFEGCTGVHKQD